MDERRQIEAYRSMDWSPINDSIFLVSKYLVSMTEYLNGGYEAGSVTEQEACALAAIRRSDWKALAPDNFIVMDTKAMSGDLAPGECTLEKALKTLGIELGPPHGQVL